MWWFNNQCLYSELDYRTPAEVEAEYYAEKDPRASDRYPRKTLGTKPRAIQDSLDTGELTTTTSFFIPR